MEAGKERLTRDTVRDATRQEIEQLKRENGELKQLVADLSLAGTPSQKNGYPDAGRRRRYQRMNIGEKAAVLARVGSSPHPTRRALRDLGVPKSTYYRWLSRQRRQGLEDRREAARRRGIGLSPQEEEVVLAAAREMPELSSRQLAVCVTDNQGFFVSESTVYRILRREVW